MKKTMLFAICFYCANLLQAQVELGIKAGANFSVFHVSYSTPQVSYQYKPGINGGVFANFLLSKKFALQPELMYSAQGSKINTNVENLAGRLQYLNFPVLLKYKIARGFFAELGPQEEWLLRARKKVISSSFPAGDPAYDQAGDNSDIKKHYKTSSLSGVIGLSYVCQSKFGAGLRYVMGLTDIANPIIIIDGVSLATNGGKLTNNTFQLYLSYVFDKKKK